MFWAERVTCIYNFLNQNGYRQVVDQMIKDYGVGGTAGEQFSIVCTWLAKLRNRNTEIYSLIKQDADEILEEEIRLQYFTEEYYKKQ